MIASFLSRRERARKLARVLSVPLMLSMMLALPQPIAESLRVELGAEHLWPTHGDRDIQTTSLNAFVGRSLFHQAWVAWRAGVTATYAAGSIVQFDEQFHDVRFADTALGFGPAFVLRVQTPELARFTLGIEGSGAFVLYSRDFPAGGDLYNFMWRAGLQLEYRACAACWIGVGYRVMHVSNGQGLGPQNPSYEARGLSVWLAWSPW
jgi:hypothetical protein